jgi:aldose 1-epimerase
MSVRPPSGEQYEIAFGDQRVTVVEVGGGLRTYTLGDRDALEGYEVGEMATAGRGQVLMPWPNRLQDGRYEFDGDSHQLPLTEPEHGNAIHGLVRWVSWRAREHEAHRVTLEHVLHPQPGYPFTLELGLEYELSASGLTARTTATNVGDTPCPYGTGAHPYLTIGAPVDDGVLRVPARTALRSDERGIPIDTVSVEGTELDFRVPRQIAETRLDNGYTDLERDDAGVARVELKSSDGQVAVALWLDEAYPYVMVFTGDRPDVERRELAVEPMTCAPNAFRSRRGLIRLEPGESVTSAWGIAPSIA